MEQRSRFESVLEASIIYFLVEIFLKFLKSFLMFSRISIRFGTSIRKLDDSSEALIFHNFFEFIHVICFPKIFSILPTTF